MKLSAADVLEKPVDIQELLERLNAAAAGKIPKQISPLELFAEDRFLDNVGRESSG